jgi:hypothetical protein
MLIFMSMLFRENIVVYSENNGPTEHINTIREQNAKAGGVYYVTIAPLKRRRA